MNETFQKSINFVGWMETTRQTTVHNDSQRFTWRNFKKRDDHLSFPEIAVNRCEPLHLTQKPYVNRSKSQCLQLFSVLADNWG